MPSYHPLCVSVIFGPDNQSLGSVTWILTRFIIVPTLVLDLRETFNMAGEGGDNVSARNVKIVVGEHRESRVSGPASHLITHLEMLKKKYDPTRSKYRM